MEKMWFSTEKEIAKELIPPKNLWKCILHLTDMMVRTGIYSLQRGWNLEKRTLLPKQLAGNQVFTCLNYRAKTSQLVSWDFFVLSLHYFQTDIIIIH